MFGLENNSFLINLAVSLLIALVTLLYFRQQLATIDHKVNSMFSLMTSMTQELNNLSRLNLLNEDNNENTEETNFNQQNIIMGGTNDNRINVSDSEESDSDDDEERESDNDEEESDGDSSVLRLSSNDEIKTLNMGSELNTNTDNIKVIDMTSGDVDDDDDESSYISNSDDNEIKSLVTDLMEQTLNLSETLDNDTELEPIELPIESLDTNVVTLENEQNVKSIEVPIDYSKMSVKALKDIVSSKNLATNVSKLKKQELIDLLSV